MRVVFRRLCGERAVEFAANLALFQVIADDLFCYRVFGRISKQRPQFDFLRWQTAKLPTTIHSMSDPSSPQPPLGDEPPAECEAVTSFRFKEHPDPLGVDAAGCVWSVITWPWWLWLWIATRLSADPTYHVPTRFGMSAIIGITTSLALLFALFRAVDAHPLFYVFSTALLLIVVVVQMRWGHIARPASIVAGAAWLPLFWVALVLFMEDAPPLWSICCAFPFLLPIGGVFGYLAGTCAGGFFLLMEMLEQYWERRLTGSSGETTPPNGAPPVTTQLDDLQHPR